MTDGWSRHRTLKSRRGKDVIASFHGLRRKSEAELAQSLFVLADDAGRHQQPGIAQRAARQGVLQWTGDTMDDSIGSRPARLWRSS